MGKAPTIAPGPASGNDIFSVTEDQVAAGGLIFNVLANDPKKTTLYSLDNATVADLLQEDLPGVAEASALGGSIRITSDGKVAYGAGLNGSLIQSLAAGETVNDTFLYAFRQGANLVWQTVQVTITGTNDAPEALADTGLAIEDMITTGSVALNDSDIDHNAVLHFAATGTLPAGFAMASDGGWSLDGSDPSYEALDAGESINLAVAYTVIDEHGASSNSTLILTVTGTNDAPLVSGAVTGTAIEDSAPVALNALACASDVDHGASLSVVGVPQELPAGVTYDAATGGFTLDPTDAAYQQLADGEVTVVTVNYGVSDGTATTPASVSWTVTGSNDVPVTTSPAAEVTEGATISGQLTALDPDHGAALSFTVAGDAPAGFSLAADGSWTFDASDPAYDGLANGEIRIVEVPFAATDEHGASAGSQLIIAVTGTNDDPVATAGLAAASEGETISGTLAAIASDIDDIAALSFSAGHLPPGFNLSADGQWTFDAGHPAYDGLGAGQSIDLVVGYHVADGQGGGADSTLTITVTGTNDAPVAIGQMISATIELYPASTTLSGQVTATDADAGAHLTYAMQGFVPDGFVMNPDGSWSWTLPLQEGVELNEGQVSAGQLSFVATDEHGATSTGVLQISLTGSNDAPIRDDAFASATEGEVVTGTYHGVDPDLGAVLSYSLDPRSDPGFTLASDGSWQFDAGNPAYQSLAAGETRQVVAGILVTDEHGASALSPLFVTVTGTNDSPSISSSFAVVDEDGMTSGQLTSNDPDNGAALTYALTGEPPAGFSLNPDGSWTFDASGSGYQSLSQGEQRELNINCSVTDEHGATGLSSLTMIVLGANDAPIAGDFFDTLLEDAVVSGRFRATDPDGHDELTYSLVSPPPEGLTVNPDGRMTWDLTGPSTQYLGQGETATITLDWRVTDQYGFADTGTWTVTLVGWNDRPVLDTAPAALPDGHHDQPYTVSTADLLQGWVDADGDLLSVTNVTADHGTVTHNGSGFFSTYTVTPDAGYSGPVTLSYRVADYRSEQAANLSFTLEAGTDIGGTTSGAVVEARYGSAGTPTASGALTIFGDDPHFTAVGTPTASTGGYGQFTVTADGLWQYNLDNFNSTVNGLNSGQTLSDSFIVHATDGTAQQIDVLIRGATDWVTISVYPNTNDPENLDTNRGPAGTDNLNATVIGTAAGEIVTGGSLNQTIDVQGGNDTVYAQGGDDTVYGGAGDDVVFGQVGNDFLNGDIGNDWMYGGSGNDVIFGNDGMDTIRGGSGFDNITGGAGFDVIIGGYNFDQLTGGADADVFVYNSVFDSGDMILDFQKGIDSIDLHGIDPNSQQAGDQAFAFSADGAAAYSIWLVQNGSNLEIYGDTDGFAGTADFMITLQNVTLSTATQPANFYL